jgi:hypothetical protein
LLGLSDIFRVHPFTDLAIVSDELNAFAGIDVGAAEEALLDAHLGAGEATCVSCCVVLN